MDGEDEEELWSVSNPDLSLASALSLGGSELTVSDVLGENSSTKQPDRKVWVRKNKAMSKIPDTNSYSNSRSYVTDTPKFSAAKVSSATNNENPSPSTSKRKRFPDPSAPSMDQFPDFDAYIAALIQHEQRLSSSSSSDPQDLNKSRTVPSSSASFETPARTVNNQPITRTESSDFISKDDDSGLLDEFYGGGGGRKDEEELTGSSSSSQQGLTSAKLSKSFLDGITLKELKEQCRARGLMVSGTKAELQARLSSK